MNEKQNKIVYWASTGLLSLLMFFSAMMYFFQTPMASEMFTNLGFPVYIIFPLGVAKILGITAILTKKSDMLKEWAYAGFFFDFLLAISAHLSIGDGEFSGALVAMLFLLTSYFTERKLIN